VCLIYEFVTSFYGTKEELLVQYIAIAIARVVQLGAAYLAVTLLIPQIINDY
jgi:hypothetical protein